MKSGSTSHIFHNIFFCQNSNNIMNQHHIIPTTHYNTKKISNNKLTKVRRQRFPVSIIFKHNQHILIIRIKMNFCKSLLRILKKLHIICMYVSFGLIKNTINDLNYPALQIFLLISLYLNSVIQLTSFTYQNPVQITY